MPEAMPDTSIETRITERIQSFDLPALMDLLAKEGYGEDAIELRSHRGTTHAPHLVQAITFERQPRRAIVTLNLGLLSVQTPLPSFFLKLLERLEYDALETFLGYFDHVLLRARVAGLFPERDASLLPGWEGNAQHRLGLLRPACPSTLHWLFARVFPEVEVRVQRATQRQRIDTRGVRLGDAVLGDGTAMGAFATIPTGGMEARLYASEATTGTGTPWPVEARRRLRSRVLPHLLDPPLLLTVLLVLRDQHGHARIEDTHHLGYEPIIPKPGQSWQDALDEPGQPRQAVLFSGDTSRHHLTQ